MCPGRPGPDSDHRLRASALWLGARSIKGRIECRLRSTVRAACESARELPRVHRESQPAVAIGRPKSLEYALTGPSLLSVPTHASLPNLSKAVRTGNHLRHPQLRLRLQPAREPRCSHRPHVRPAAWHNMARLWTSESADQVDEGPRRRRSPDWESQSNRDSSSWLIVPLDRLPLRRLLQCYRRSICGLSTTARISAMNSPPKIAFLMLNLSPKLYNNPVMTRTTAMTRTTDIT